MSTIKHFLLLYKFQPFSVTKELGKEYNAHCALVPNDNDWILILDYDAMILSPLAYSIMDMAIQRYPATQVFGAVTNRIGYVEQRVHPVMSKNADMLHHLYKSNEAALVYPKGECKQIATAAGFFLLFRKSYWNNNKFQDAIINETGQLFDHTFCKRARRDGKIMKILGVYVWHTYRLLNKSWLNRDHLV